ncbi:pyruvate kinase [Bacillus sp. DJP31]|uniref:pyruvate kinase n=1 Tax=Bacillus sp. DJP31 TaxID=3409789 RepID=UPI003BB7DD07
MQKEAALLVMEDFYLEIQNLQATLVKKNPLMSKQDQVLNLLSYIRFRNCRYDSFHTFSKNHGLPCFDHKAILFSVNQMYQLLSCKEGFSEVGRQPFIHPQMAEQVLLENSSKLFGAKGTHTPIMVTLDKKMLARQEVFYHLIKNGMNVARIKCAHDDQGTWEQFIFEIREAGERLQKDCKIYVDLSGPKLRVGEFANPTNLRISLRKGNKLRLYKDSNYLGHAKNDLQPASVGVNLPKALSNVKQGDRIFMDDGKLAGVITEVNREYVEMVVISSSLKSYKLKEGKGINLPDSLLYLSLPSLTRKDLQDLRFIVNYADILGVSFIHHPQDLRRVKQELAQLTDRKIPIVAKIETKHAVQNLASILVEGLEFDVFGIMIARGDLAVEVGFDKLAIVQESILNLSHAAHIPVIWATQVLDNLAKTGIPTRAEISDVAVGSQAQCLMLNKGPFIEEAVGMLSSVLSLIKNEHTRDRTAESIFSQYL